MKIPKIIHEQKPKHISPRGNQHMLILYKSYKKINIIRMGSSFMSMRSMFLISKVSVL